ncbi:MAG: ABC transporter substrate-binding protein [Planctomycetota bacterium]
MRRLTPYAVALLALIALPFLVRGGASHRAAVESGPEVIVITPSTEQIRDELGEAFALWHERRFGTRGRVIWSAPGGAVEIRRLLTSAWEARLRQGLPVGGDADVLLGGGSYEFETLKRPVEVRVDGQTRAASVLEPVALPADVVAACYPQPELAGQRLYDADGWWYGVALSTFGIVWNAPALDRLGLQPPTRWADLSDARLLGWVTMVNPSQSGSVLAAFDSIVQRVGWRKGLAILRRAAANARTFAPSGTRGPLDVGSGDAAMAVAIDFYARFESQAVAAAGQADRMGFTAPAGESAVDPDPVAMLRNPPHP